MDPREINISDYQYLLPEEKIAKYPLPHRDASKLLVYDGKITDSTYRNLAEHIPANSLLVFNDTKVIEARILFQKQSGGVIEVFCLHPHTKHGDITTAMNERGTVQWHCLIGGASKWKPGQVLSKNVHTEKGQAIIEARYIEKTNSDFVIQLNWNVELTFAEILHFAGAIPLPPYIKRKPEQQDQERYQTVYANHHGSVAAPTAGLHFTEHIFQELEKKNIQRSFITLHVGAGTFKPVSTEKLGDHMMHEEFFTVSMQTIVSLLSSRNVIAVGTTTLRTLESLYWLAYLVHNTNDGTLLVPQWLPYEEKYFMPVEDALQIILNWMKRSGSESITAKTQLIIVPGYKIRMAKALITNFHQSGSTLLLLVAACIGEEWKSIYEHALKNSYRFLSYGDGMLLNF